MTFEESAKMLETIIPYFYRILRNEKSIFCKNFKLTPTQLEVLIVLKSESMNLSKLSDLTLLDSSTLVGTVDRLEKKGFIKKKVSHKDRRKNILSLTNKGLNLINSIPSFSSPLLNSSIEEFTEEQREQFMLLMNKILINMKLSQLVPFNSKNSNEIKPVISSMNNSSKNSINNIPNVL